MLGAYTAYDIQNPIAGIGDIAHVIDRLVELAIHFASSIQTERDQETGKQTSTPQAPTAAPSSSDAPNAETWFRELHPKLYAYVRYRIADIAQAEDLTSDIIERALTHLDSYNARKGAFSTWLFRIAHNTLANYFKQQHRRGQYQVDLGENLEDLATDEPSPEQSVAHQEEIARLLVFVRALSARQQEILSLRFAGQLTNREIARVLNMNERTVSVTLLRALRALRHRLQIQLDGAKTSLSQSAGPRQPITPITPSKQAS